MEIKVCKKCGKELTLDRFDKNHLSKDGLSGICKECKAKYNRNRTLKIKAEKMMKSEGVPFNIDESNSGGAGLLAYSARQLIEELRRRGYKGNLTYSWSIDIEKI